MPCCFVVYCSMYRTTMEVGTKTDFNINISSYSLSAFLKSKIAVGTVGHFTYSSVWSSSMVKYQRYGMITTTNDV